MSDEQPNGAETPRGSSSRPRLLKRRLWGVLNRIFGGSDLTYDNGSTVCSNASAGSSPGPPGSGPRSADRGRAGATEDILPDRPAGPPRPQGIAPRPRVPRGLPLRPLPGLGALPRAPLNPRGFRNHAVRPSQFGKTSVFRRVIVKRCHRGPKFCEIVSNRRNQSPAFCSLPTHPADAGRVRLR
jgi:hypothetical protein